MQYDIFGSIETASQPKPRQPKSSAQKRTAPKKTRHCTSSNGRRQRRYHNAPCQCVTVYA